MLSHVELVVWQWLFLPDFWLVITPRFYHPVSTGRVLATFHATAGEENQDIIEAEFNRIKYNLMAESSLKSETENQNLLTRLKSLSTDPTFLKPLGIVITLYGIGYSWTGQPAICFYMVPLLKYVQQVYFFIVLFFLANR